MAAPLPLFKHQKQSVKFHKAQPRVLDASDAGTGKTRVQIEAFRVHRKSGGKCALIIAPRSLLRSAWQADFEKFARCVEMIRIGDHLQHTGIVRIAEIVSTMNRKKPRQSLIRILRDHMPTSVTGG